VQNYSSGEPTDPRRSARACSPALRRHGDRSEALSASCGHVSLRLRRDSRRGIVERIERFGAEVIANAALSLDHGAGRFVPLMSKAEQRERLAVGGARVRLFETRGGHANCVRTAMPAPGQASCVRIDAKFDALDGGSFIGESETGRSGPGDARNGARD